MIARIAALVFIFVCTTIAWIILGATIFSRTYNSGPGLSEKVQSSWGSPQFQSPPSAAYNYTVTHKTMTVVDGRSVQQTTEENVQAPLPLESSRMDVSLNLEHR